MEPKQFVKDYAIRSLVCCFSGGKDSLVATHYVMSELEDFDIDKHVVFVDTTVMIPITLEFVTDIATQFHWPLKILRPDITFWDYAEQLGPPTVHRRWCCYRLKLKPIFDFLKQLKPQRGKILGLRKDESLRRKKMNLTPVWHDKRRGVHAWLYKPILDWTEKDVLRYIKKNALPMPPHYKLGIKETCMCGAFSSKKQAMILKAQFPELFDKFLKLETHLRPGRAAFFFRNKRVYARDLQKQKVLSEMS